MRFPGVLDRYVVRSVIAPGTLAFLVYTFLLMMRAIFSLIEQIFVQGLDPADALKIVLVTVPHIVVLTIPLSFLFGVLLAIGRMNSDRELVALQAAGVSPVRFVPPVLLLALLLTALNGYLFLFVIPSSNLDRREIMARAFSSAARVGRIEPKVFYEDFPNTLLYVQDVDQANGMWKNVLVYDSGNPKEERLTLAKRGRIVLAEEGPGAADVTHPSEGLQGGTAGAEPWLLLEDVVSHQIDPDRPTTTRVNAVEQQLVKIRTSTSKVTYRVSARERSTAQLFEFGRSGEYEDEESAGTAQTRSAEDRANEALIAGIELHRRFAIPAAALVFALIGLPLGVGSSAGGKGRGFVLSVFVVIVYYIMINNGEVLALKGKVPVWLGIWFPNLMMAVTGVFMMTRMGRWLGERHAGESLLTRGWRLLSAAGERLWARHRSGWGDEESGVTGSIPIRVQRRRYSARFPTLFDRYLLRRLMGPLILVLVTTMALYIVIDLSSRLDDVAKNNISFEVVVAYYLSLMPQVVLDVIPMGLMIAVLILLTLLERERQLTAFKSSGISLYRVMLPVILVAITSTVVMWMLAESLVPQASREAKRLQDRIKGRSAAAPQSYQAGNRLWLVSREDEGTFYKFLRYDSSSQTLVRFTMFRFDDQMRLRFHLTADRAWHENGRWVSDSGWYRRFTGDGGDVFTKISSETEVGIVEGPDYFGQEYHRPSEMTFRDLRSYIAAVSESGYRPTKLIVKWHQKLSYPLSALILALLALPFGLSRGGQRVSTMQGVGLALGLGIGYFLLVGLLGKMGEADLLPPVVGAWSPALLTILLAVNRLSVLRS